MTDQIPQMPPKLAAALVAAQLGSNAVEKGGTNKFHNYRYARGDDMIAEGREALGAADCALMTLGWTHGALETPRQEGKVSVVGRVIVAYRLVHKSGESVDWKCSSFVVAGDGRPSDKAEMAAVTENLAYTIRGLLMIPRVDEGASVERRDDRGVEAPASSSAPRQAQQAANDETFDGAHVALAADFKRRIADLPDLSAFKLFAEDLSAAELPKPLADDVLAELVCAGVRFAVDGTDLDLWVPRLRAWQLGPQANERAKAAWLRRSEEIDAQAGAAA